LPDFDQILTAALYSDQEKAIARLSDGSSKLAHYTSAENGLNLLKSKTFWLRNVKCMNDYSEVSHGIDTLVRVLRKDEDRLLEALGTALDSCADGTRKLTFDAFDRWATALPFEVYVGCLAEHDTNDNVGLLSMWRAYGGPTGGVAFVFNPHPMLQETEELKAYSVPVFYLDEHEMEKKFSNFISDIIGASEYADNVSAESLANEVVGFLVSTVIGAKHPAFKEEREFRIVYTPSILPSDHIIADSVNVRGIPQVVQKIPLEDDPAKGLHKADIPNLVERIIIGPTNYAMPVWTAFVEELRRCGVENPEERVVYSGIPLRTSN
jgi:hypothetical protein